MSGWWRIIEKIISADIDSEKPLIQNTNYTLKITYTLKNSAKVERTLTFKTKSYDFSSYELKYDDDIFDTVYIYTNELKVGDLKVYRSETADGEYSEIKIEGGAYPFLFCRDESDTLETDKTAESINVPPFLCIFRISRPSKCITPFS